jgi:hypothetical protein
MSFNKQFAVLGVIAVFVIGALGFGAYEGYQKLKAKHAIVRVK